MSNVQLQGDRIVINRGRDSDVLNVRFRPIREFAPMTGRTLAINPFINVMLDKRAPGLWAGVIGGPKSKVEHLAELASKQGLVGQIAEIMLDSDLVRRINDKLIRNNQRFKGGVMTLDYTTLLRAVSSAIGAASSTADPKRAVARILTEVLSRAYSKLNVMVPFVGAVELTAHRDPIADLDMLITAAQVTTVTEVFEAIDLGSAFSDAKEFNPSVTEGLLGPLLVSAANRLMNTLRYEKYMRDTAVLVGRYITKAYNLPDHLRDNADLEYLASNASFAMGSIQRAAENISTPDFELREAITYTVMRLRELKRFETISLEKYKSMYSHDIVKAPSGRIAGIVLARNEQFKLAAQVSKFIDRADFVIQAQVPVGEAYVAPLSDAVTRAFEGNILGRTVTVAAQNLITRRWELDDDQFGAHTFVHNVSEVEEFCYGMAFAKHLYVTDIPLGTDMGVPITIGGAPRLVFECDDGKLFYEPRGMSTGSTVMTEDPLEVVLLSGVDHRGTSLFPVRPQTILDDMRKAVLPSMPDDITVDMDKPVKMTLPDLEGKTLELNTSLQNLLGLGELGKMYLTVEGTMRDQVNAAFASLILIYDELKTFGGEVDNMLAKQVATATHQIIGRVTASDTFRRMLQTLFVRFMQDAQFKGRQHMLRSHIADAFVQHQLALNTSSMLLLKLGVMQYGLQEDLSRIFDAERVVETAITSEVWDQAMRPMN